MDRSLQVFLTVAKTLNFSRAAEELHLTQPGVSLHIQSLEKHYKTKLLDRTNKYVRLTPAGEILFQQGQEIMNQYARTKRLIDDLTQSAQGHLAIGASFTFGEYILPGIISGFWERYPNITPAITIENTRDIGERVVQGELDVGIVEGELHHGDLVIHPIATDELVLILPVDHRLAGQKEINLAEVSNEHWILREKGSGTRSAADQMFKHHGLTPGSVMEFGSNQVIKESVETGLGISIISRWAIQKELTLGAFSQLRIREYPIMRHFYSLTHASSFHTKAMDLFLIYLRKLLHTDLPQRDL
ncbi:LysR family transcriptional regulator [Kroppenstedtia pulmonis]|uniref:LysR family transcriptional regulator n=1 Tax=Kroppenstedtia pulmonis TaxID=1380685 RepID=A0A7D3XJM2_9BACL|nr:LysR family transcriptional regulator [Kroppenstedtia pulmonis]QKG85244.1 LysR family transcriptional regulator [Kroppenstedtia pulmonis]